MKRGVIILLTALAILLPTISANALSSSGGGSWWYYRDITISNTGGALTDYQVLVNLTGASFPTGANTSGADIRFTNANGAELSYWIESWDYASKSARIWVNITSISTGGSTSIRMYYGNPNATSSSNGDATFLFFDDFDKYSGIDDPNFLNVWERFNNQGGSALENGRLHMWSAAICCNGQTWLTKMNFTKNIRAKFELKNNGVEDYFHPRGIAAFLRSVHNYQTWDTGLPEVSVRCCPGGNTFLEGDSSVTTGAFVYNDAFHSLEVTAYEYNMSLYRDRIYLGSVGITQYNRDGAFGFYVHGDGGGADNVYFDNVRLAKYSEPEPSVYIGTSPPANSIGYSALVATGQNTFVQSSNGSFGLIPRGYSKTINNSVILNNTGDISAKVEARFNDSRGGIFGLVSGANVLNATNFALGLPSALMSLSNAGANVQVAAALDARLGVPNEQAAGDYQGTVVLTFSNNI